MAGFSQTIHQQWKKNQLQNDTGQSVDESPGKKRLKGKVILLCWSSSVSAIPHTIRPASMPQRRENIDCPEIFLFRPAVEQSLTAPYAASSKAIAIAFGYIAGMPKRTLRSSGHRKPIRAASGPQVYAARKIGQCIGRSVAPMVGICSTRKGRTWPSARNIADNVSV